MSVYCSVNMSRGKSIPAGGGLVGCELALDLAENNRQVTILEALPEILSAGAPVPHMNKIMLKDLLKFHHVQQIADRKSVV